MRRWTYRKQDKHDILDDIPASLARTYQRSPAPPVLALCHAVLAPTTEGLVQVELSLVVNIAAYASLQVPHPITGNIDACCDAPYSDACRNEDQPNMTGICQHPKLPKNSGSAREQILQTHALFAVFIDPIDGRKIIVAHASSGPFDIPVQARGILSILQAHSGVRAAVQIREDCIRRRSRAHGAAAIAPGRRCEAIPARCERRGEEP
jgi:hypothetical protein